MRTILSTLSILFVMNLFPNWMHASDKKIDFNFPQDVSKDALADLQSALKTHDGELTVDALIRFSIAQSGISDDNLPLIIDRIEETIKKEKRPEIKALLHYFEAVVFKNYLNSTYDDRDEEIEGEEPAADYTEWNQEQFNARIDSLLAMAMADPEALQAIPVTSMSRVIKCNELGALYVPTLYQFLALQCKEMSHDYEFTTALSNQYELSVAGNVPAYLYACMHGMASHSSTIELYRKHIDNEHCGMLLDDLRWSRDGYAATREYLIHHPKGTYANDAQNQINEFEALRVYVSVAQEITAHTKVKATVTSRNAKQVEVVVYRLDDKIALNGKEFSHHSSSLTKVDSKIVAFDHTIPFNETQTVELDGLDYGQYIIAPITTVGDKTVTRDHFPNSDVIVVSDLVAMNVAQQDQNNVLVVDRETGAPIQGATVTVVSGTKKELLLTTDKDGIVTIPAEYNWCEVKASKGKDRFGKKMSARKYENEERESYIVEWFTDLGIYRPGETIKWALAYYTRGDNTRKIASGKKLEIRFYDPNNKLIDTTKVTTDDYGRACGEFTIPTDRLNGQFRLSVYNGSSSEYVAVSEYKTPTFAVEYTTQRDQFVAGEPVVIEGKAMTYSGMPVAGSEITIALKQSEWSWSWRHFMGSHHKTTLMDTVVTTDTQGNFKIELPAELFPENKTKLHWAINNYVLTARCTNAAGESQEANKSFIVGDRTGIEMPSQCTRLVDGPITLPITYNTTSETEKSVVCTYELIEKEAKNIVATGNFDTADATIDVSKVASGEYLIKVHMLGTDAQDNATNATMELVLYRNNDTQAPINDCALWLPTTNVDANDNGKASIVVGTSSPEAHIYYVMASHKGVEKKGWLHYKPGLHKLDVEVPARDEEILTVELISVYKDQIKSHTVRVSCQARQRALKLNVTSFRDKLVPGERERWTFKITDKEGKPLAAAMLLEMFDKALNSLSENTWSFYPSMSYPSKYYTHLPSMGYTASTDISWQALNSKPAWLMIPSLYLYGQELFGYMSKELMMMESIAMPSMPSEKGVLSDIVGARNAVFQYAVPEEDVAMGGGADDTSLDNVSMRMADVKTALWQPMLTSDAEGNVVVEFDAPQFNTTWIVQAVAFDRDLYSSRLNREVLTQKEVMVKSALPRFVRTGDKASLAATVMNATDVPIAARTIIELFDPRTNVVIASKESDVQLAAHGTDAVSMDWDVPEGMPFVGFRIKAASGRHNDGEQVMLPVLANTQPIIETQPFYIEQGAQGHTVTVPESARNARVTIEYCDNPTWYCVTALPTLFDNDYKISTQAAHALFSIDVAQGIAQGNPKIKEAVDHWNAHPEDSVLVSMLEKNKDLKIGTLLASPWMQESERQTLRMSQIGRLMDTEQMQAERKKVVDALLDNQMGDGGWCWFKHPQSTSSIYTTHTVLELIGEIKHLGYLGDDSRLDNAVKRALQYYDDEWLRIYKQRKDKKDYSGFDDFAYVRTLFLDVPMSKKVKKLFDNSLAAMKKDWSKGLSLSSKAYFALTLERNGEHKAAELITESIRQHAITKPSLGMYWDNLQSGWRYFDKVAVTAVILQALNEVDHRNDEIDLVRKWMLLMKQTNDWGSSSLAADAVYSLLATGTNWLQPTSEAKISIDDKPINIADAEKYLGYVRRTINVAPGATIKIERNGTSPAWGAVYSQFKATMAQTRQVSIDELEISKQYYVYGADGKLTLATALKVGDKVQVRTIIKCNRDLDFVTVVDERAACFEPVDQLSGYRYKNGNYYYLETKDSKTNIFFTRMDKGTHILGYDMNVTAPGTYNAGVASAQCQYAPQIAAHSAGTLLKVE